MPSSGTVGERIRGWADGIGGYLAGAAALTFFALLALLLILQSPGDMLLWTGTRVVGRTCGGLVCYSYGGQNYTLDTPGMPPDDERRIVYLRPADPSDAEVDSSIERAGDVALTVLPVAAGVAVIGLGVRRRRRQSG